MEVAKRHWETAAENWDHLGAPLRPSAEDMRFITDAVRQTDLCRQENDPQINILGVTPEYFYLHWPARAMITAIDHNIHMIRHVWPGSASAVVQKDWRNIDRLERNADIFLCDGGWHLLDFPEDQTNLARALARNLTPGGSVIARFFIPPPERETVQHVYESLVAGTIRDLNCLKLRLGMALQVGPRAGVALHEIWTSFAREISDYERLANNLNWNLKELRLIDAYRDSGARYHFVTLAEIKCIFEEAGFFLRDVYWPTSYAMAAQCPTLHFSLKV